MIQPCNEVKLVDVKEMGVSVLIRYLRYRADVWIVH